MAQVNYSSTAENQLQELILTLYEQEYFGFLESAEDYVNAIYDFIDRLPQHRFRAAKDKRYGDWFCRYTQNKKTSWFIFFSIDHERYLVQYITNNHSLEYPQLVAWLE